MIWLSAAFFVVAGLVVGAVHFVLLHRAVRLHAGNGGIARIAPLHLLRGGLSVAAFWIVAQQGAVPLLAALLGFLIARVLVQRRLGAD